MEGLELKNSFDVIIKNKNVVVSSLKVAEIFKKQHKNVLRDIDNLKEDWEQLSKELTPNLGVVKNELSSKVSPVKFNDCFFESNYITKDGRTVRSYDMSRTGFTLLANGFNGKRALRFKLAYIAEFDHMENEKQKRQLNRQAELPIHKSLTDAINEWEFKKPHSFIHFHNILSKSTTGYNVKQLRARRGFNGKEVGLDLLTSDEQPIYLNFERIVIAMLQAQQPYDFIKQTLNRMIESEVSA